MNKHKTLLLIAFGLILTLYKCYGQDTTKSHLNFSIRYSFYYNYKIIHHSPVVSIEFGGNDFYIGPEFSFVPNILEDPPSDIIYEKKANGFNFGYRYYFINQSTSKLRLFTQLNFSIYNLKYQEYQLGPPFVTERKKTTVENTASLGIDYSIRNIHLFAGGGIGSTDGFFLLLDSFIPCSYVGLGYTF